jgi:hypothetical protein
LVLARSEQSAATEAIRRVRRRTQQLGLIDPDAANITFDAIEISREPIQRVFEREPGMAFYHEG